MFKVGQKVWCAMFGEGEVTNISTSNACYPVVVSFVDKIEDYTSDGKYRTEAAQTLFPYPVEIIKKVSKPYINWEHVRDEYKFLVQDDMGNAWLYVEEPTLDDDNGCWDVELGEFALADTHVSYAPGTCDWRESLIKRPESDNRVD